MRYAGMISIWFFIGVLLLLYGALILGTAIVEWAPQPEHRVAMAGLHAGVWWGVVLLALGATYFIHFAPWRHR